MVCTLAAGQGPGPSPTDLLVGNASSERSDSLTEPDRIEADRDSFTPATSVVGRGRLDAESAYTFSQNRDGRESGHGLSAAVCKAVLDLVQRDDGAHRAVQRAHELLLLADRAFGRSPLS
jgi:hypothetical protein